MKKKGMFSIICGDWFKPLGNDIREKKPYITEKTKGTDVILILVQIMLLVASTLSMKYGDYIAYTPARDTEWVYTALAVFFIFLTVVIYFVRTSHASITKSKFEDVEGTVYEDVQQRTDR